MVVEEEEEGAEEDQSFSCQATNTLWVGRHAMSRQRECVCLLALNR